MLRVGVTGGIGSGKSTVSRRLAELGAVVIDADKVAREVVEPGQPTLAALSDRFGANIIRQDGSLDRAALAAIAFPDPSALADLNAITGPAIADRVAQLRQVAPKDAVTVYDMPLLVERNLWPHEHLTVVVEVAAEERVRRLVKLRGLSEQDARHRIATQASDDERRAAADVVLDNGGSRSQLTTAVEALWHDRLAPYNANLVTQTPTRRPHADPVVDPRPGWAARGRRHCARLRAAVGGIEDIEGTDTSMWTLDHIGSTSVPDLAAKDVIDLQLGVRALADADTPGFREALARAGWIRHETNTSDHPHPPADDPARWHKRYYRGADPADIAHLHIREIGSPGWEFALLFRDWLRADPTARADYAAEKRRLLAADSDTARYVADKEAWFEPAWVRAHEWARETAWCPKVLTLPAED